MLTPDSKHKPETWRGLQRIHQLFEQWRAEQREDRRVAVMLVLLLALAFALLFAGVQVYQHYHPPTTYECAKTEAGLLCTPRGAAGHKPQR